MSRLQLTLLLVIASGLSAGTASAEKVFDPGTGIYAVLVKKNIDIPISLTDPSTAAEMVGVGDSDHYIIVLEGMEMGEGLDGDIIDNFAWTCSGGEVTQGSNVTTWTAPDTGGFYDIEAAVNDKPKPFGEGESGDRDDEVAYAGYASNMEQAVAVEATIAVVTSGQFEGNMSPFNEDEVDGYKLHITDPDDPATRGITGFLKRVEVRGTIIPTLPEGRDGYAYAFMWRQDQRGWWLFDGAHQGGSPFNSWSPDNPNSGNFDLNPRDDANNRIQMLDWPGWDTGGWDGPQDDDHHTLQFVGIDAEGAHEFRNAVLYKGWRISKEWDDDPEWTRECRLYSNPGTGKKWTPNVDN